MSQYHDRPPDFITKSGSKIWFTNPEAHEQAIKNVVIEACRMWRKGELVFRDEKEPA